MSGNFRPDLAARLLFSTHTFSALQMGISRDLLPYLDDGRLEAMAAGRPVLVTSDAFAPLVADLPLALLRAPNDTAALAAGITALAEATPAELDAVGAQLRERVEREHSLRHWAECLRRLLVPTEGSTD